MIIYIDLLIILNFFIDLILLMGTSTLLKRKASIKRICLGALVGSLSCLLLFYINNNYVLLLYKFIVSILMILIAFKYESFKYFKDNLVWLYILSIILGGAIYLLSDQITLSNKGLVFGGNGLKINLFMLIIISPFIIYKYVKESKNYQITYSNYYDISIYYDEYVLSGVGFLDTGNNLRDPFFNRPIILVDRNLIHDNISTFLVPYYTLNKSDLLDVFKPKKIIINNKTIKNVLIGLTNVNIDGIKIILNKEAI